MLISYKKLFNGINVNTIICIAYKSHYEALKISNTATHKEIKDAYYRLSMIYHPDKNKGCEEAANIFRDITSAYEVLGNARQRKLYDSGANLNKTNTQYNNKKPFETMNTKGSLYKTKILNREYNFEDWSKAHYKNIYQRQYEARESITQQKMYKEIVSKQNSYNLITIMMLVTIFLLVGMFEVVNQTTVDRNRIIKKIKDDRN